MRRSDRLVIDESMGDCGLLDLYGRLGDGRPAVCGGERIGWSWAGTDAAGSRATGDLSPLLLKWLFDPPRIGGRTATAA